MKANETIDIVKQMISDGHLTQEVAEKYFPELAESEDERIRKALIRFHKSTIDIDGIKCEDILAWLEKQGEQNCKIIKGKNYFCVKTHNYAGVEWIKGTKYYASDNYTLVNQGCECYCPEYSKEEHNNLFEEVKYDGCVEKQGEQSKNDDKGILHRFSFYSYKDEPNILYLAGLYVDNEYRNKGIGTKILEVADEVAKSINCHTIRLKTKKDSNAERLYRTHGYNSLATEESDEIWLEKQGEQNLIKIPKFNSEDYGIDGLWHAVRILEETLGTVEGYQSDDGILEHRCAITAVKSLYEQKLVEWSEEDETGWTNTMIMIKECAANHYNKDSITLVLDWLKSLKNNGLAIKKEV